MEIKQSVITTKIKNRIAQNRNCNAAFVGDVGSGKSWAAVKLAKEIDPSFTIDRVAFSTLDWLEIIYEKKPPAGSVVIYDEAGAGVHNREWWKNNEFIKSMQTNRYKNLIVFFTLPIFTFLDSQAQSLVHFLFEFPSNRIIVNGNNLCNYRQLQTNPYSGKQYRKRLFSTHEIKGRCWIGKPDPKLIKDYEAKSIKFKDDLGAQLLKKARESQGVKLTKRQQQVYNLYVKEQRTQQETADTIGILQSQVSATVRALRDKGLITNIIAIMCLISLGRGVIF